PADSPRIGITWGDNISEERQRELDAILAAWDAETDHGDRKGPFDRGPHKFGVLLTGADVYWLTERAKRDASDELLVTLHLEGAFLIGAALEDADLAWAHLEFSLLNGAHLEHARLVGAHLEGATLDETHLERADIGGSYLQEAYLGEAHLEHADLTEAN